MAEGQKDISPGRVPARRDPATGEAVVSLFARQEVVGLVRQTLREEGRASVEGLWGSSAPALAAALLSDCPSTLLYVVAHVDSVDGARDDWRLFSGYDPPVFPAWEALPTEADVSDEILADRLRILKDLAAARGGESAAGNVAATLRSRLERNRTAPPRVLVTTIQALMQPVPSPSHLADNTLELEVGREYRPDEVRRWLAERGFRPAELVLEPGQFAVRGGILDVFPPTSSSPYRAEFFGDELESLRSFDPASQRSDETRDRVAISFVPMRTDAAGDLSDEARGAKSEDGPIAPQATTNLMDYLPPDAWIVWQDPLQIAEVGRSFLARLAGPTEVYTFEAVVQQARAFRRLDLSSFTTSGVSDAFSLRTESLPAFSGHAEAVREELGELASAGPVILFSDREAERDRIAEIVSAMGARLAATRAEAQGRIRLGIGRLAAGFRLVAENVTVLANHELFQRYQDRRRLRRRFETRAIDTWTDLARGDLVVHVVHGIGRYLGMKTLSHPRGRRGAAGEVPAEDHLVLEFRDKVRVYVPASQVDLVQKYIGGFKGRPQLSRVGGKAWAEKKRRAADAVEDLAAEMLRLQAIRQTRPGIAYPEDTLWQKEFEASFPYPETDDQLAAMQEIKRDMRSPRPMDRLVCGDVGYGKTELAVRAAFKAVEAGKQVAVLVPTTVLAEQHLRTFRERMADYPVVVEMLSRFQTRGGQADVLRRFLRGQVDVVIGTHRLLSADVRPADLGLLVVDEEQRFGVEHKERLKRMRQTVDVLTLTATPIPRTLHMSLLGIRDISSLSTPPQDRRAVRTEVCPWDDSLVRGAILRELGRDGQVFFVHNRVRTIEAVAERVQHLVPEARVVFAHGQMPERDLESRMLDFFAGRVDVLVSTTIIESGLDVPRANTMFIHEADRFGLADLHQLRGRVGRYKYRAHCYFLLPESRPMTPAAAKRLRAIERYSELGAGFQIAMRDLEIRGAGNILGSEQSGHIAAIGYELYCRLLDASVRRSQGLAEPDRRRADFRLDLPAFFPKTYVPTESQRISLYRQLERAASVDVLRDVADEIVDMFGPMPAEVANLVDLEEVRLLAGRARIAAIHRKGADLMMTAERAAAVEALFARCADPEIRRAGTVRVIDGQTVLWRLGEDRGAEGALGLLKKWLAGAPGGN
ncbi:MAG TPA: transcription-repair coupling factor [Phycisphaerae bacterium]|nr:transcription-repair coupling factor [Phycisphaerae bacterium]